MTFLYILIAILVVAIALFVCWFIMYKKSGRCPICALKKLTSSSKITIDTKNEKDYNNGAALTPPMGWSSWNTLRQNINERVILETAAAMKNSGLVDAGYNYLNLDDCWQSSSRDKDGNLQADYEKFPSGITSIANKVNSVGIKLGIYTSNGSLTCEDLPASLGNEVRDAATFADWGCEFLKYDFCHNVVISGNAPAIESLKFNRIGRDEQIEVKAKEAKLTGKAQLKTIKAFDSKKCIVNLNHNAGSARFVVNSESKGTYVLTITYFKSKSFNDQYLQVFVNGELNEIFFPKTKAFTPEGRVQIKVQLNEGINEVLLKNPVVTKADSAYIQYTRMGNALKQASKNIASYLGRAEKPITYSICEWGRSNPWMWGQKAGNLWRTTPDILPTWWSIYGIYKRNIKHYNYSQPGAFNDPDMLEVGNGKLSLEENKSHFSLWCMMAAPLILGNDIRKFVTEEGRAKKDDKILQIVTNKELIAIDQDKLCKSAKRIKCVRGVDIIARPLKNGDIAICLLNKGSGTACISLDIDDFTSDKYLNFSKSKSTYAVNELWSGEHFSAKTISTTLSKHATKVYRISN